jgi:hypothetical protein
VGLHQEASYANPRPGPSVSLPILTPAVWVIREWVAVFVPWRRRLGLS